MTVGTYSRGYQDSKMAATTTMSRKYLDGIIIPVSLLVVGTLIVKRDWTPYAAVLAVALGTLKFFNMRKLLFSVADDGGCDGRDCTVAPMAMYANGSVLEPKKALNPDVFQEFELKEKTVISHNVAM